MRLPAAFFVLAATAFGATVANTSTKLVEAVKTGDRPTALSLLQQKANVNTPEPDGTTAIMWAVRQDDPEMADRLIRAGADVKARNRYGATALSEAVNAGSAATVGALLKAGADPKTLTTDNGETVLMTAARAGNADAMTLPHWLESLAVQLSPAGIATIMRVPAQRGSDGAWCSRSTAPADRPTASSSRRCDGF